MIEDNEEEIVRQRLEAAKLGVPICVLASGDFSPCEGDVRAWSLEPTRDEQGNIVQYGINMAACTAHAINPLELVEQGFQQMTDEAFAEIHSQNAGAALKGGSFSPGEPDSFDPDDDEPIAQQAKKAFRGLIQHMRLRAGMTDE